MGEQKASSAEGLIAKIWAPPEKWNTPGEWFWWFWLFFIHDKDTARTGKCRQVMILWSIKKDPKIKCNSLDIEFPVQLEKTGGKYLLNGAAAAWYFDGERMHEEIVLEKTKMALDPEGRRLSAPGETPSEFYMEGEEFVTKISGKNRAFEFRARQTDSHPAVGPTYGSMQLPRGIGVEGTRLEIMRLSGFETGPDGEKKGIFGTAYFQKILMAAPPPQWYWGLYHFRDGSFFTYMVLYLGRAVLADNLWSGADLRKPTLSIKQDVLIYHAPSGRVFSGDYLELKPEKIEGTSLWRHCMKGGGRGFRIGATAEAYSHSCWKFTKGIGPLPAKSTFKYNEYPATIRKLVLELDSGEKIELENGWGNMENAWGFLI
jgi:hypothetical protein